MFSPIVQDHFYNRRNTGPLASATHVGLAGIPGEGPHMQLWFAVQDNVIRQAAYDTYGCPAAVACGSMVAAVAAGRRVDEIRRLTGEELVRLVGGLPEGKEHCPQLAIAAVARAFREEAGNGL